MLIKTCTYMYPCMHVHTNLTIYIATEMHLENMLKGG